MTNTYKTTYEILHRIYNKYRRRYKENSDSKHMCCMWPTNNPPDIIEETDPFCDIENTFNITIDDDEALNLFYMLFPC
ncbi:MAG: hypothetical protein A2096_16080 [Spirochaetes bacterium GWF1_41_5]|nr:MAG: hypothetical protein A2096_16080 [Spirochaetes bacterium GWF1_41_5]HBE04008.1 hypothetical protein [Spirochaetia bacterium]